MNRSVVGGGDESLEVWRQRPSEGFDVDAVDGGSVARGNTLDEEVSVGFYLQDMTRADPRAVELGKWALADGRISDHDQIASAET